MGFLVQIRADTCYYTGRTTWARTTLPRVLLLLLGGSTLPRVLLLLLPWSTLPRVLPPAPGPCYPAQSTPPAPGPCYPAKSGLPCPRSTLLPCPEWSRLPGMRRYSPAWTPVSLLDLANRRKRRLKSMQVYPCATHGCTQTNHPRASSGPPTPPDGYLA